jgi:HAD superfamily phosphoserine phosphatase-like hydrolase
MHPVSRVGLAQLKHPKYSAVSPDSGSQTGSYARHLLAKPMSKPKVFVSSTYVDLKDLREILRNFILDAGYEAIVFEKGGIYYDHTKSIAESCCDTINECDILVLVIGGRYGSAPHPPKKRMLAKFNSITRQEYLAARQLNIPIFTFVSSNVLDEYETFKKNRARKIKYAHVDDPQIFELIDDIAGEKTNNLVRPYREAVDITEHLKEQWAEMLHRHLARTKSDEATPNRIYINGYKLCYFRKMRKLSFVELSGKTGIEPRTLRRLEKVRVVGDLSIDCFTRCDSSFLPKLEAALGCAGKLEAGKEDDFLTEYMQFYRTYKAPKASQPTHRSQKGLFRTRAVAFDFDGTLTRRDDERTTWEKIWVALGYTENECAQLHRRYQNKEFTHQEWCDRTLEKFRTANFRVGQLDLIANATSLIKGAGETIQRLRHGGIKLYIISGSIKHVIRQTLGDLYNCFEQVSANEVVFDGDGIVSRIVGTPYDFEGKATFLKRIIEDNDFSSLDVLFIGNSCNDVFASRSGVRTLCVNPRFTDPDDTSHWTYAIRRMESLEEIMEFVSI